VKFEADDISVAIKGCTIVAGCSFAVQPGEFVGLIGPNGAGKSTLLKGVVGVRHCSSGTVNVDGRDFFSFSPQQRARSVSFLPQDRRVEWRLPSYDIIMLGRFPHRASFGSPTVADHAAVEQAMEACDVLQLCDRPAAVLSGGERSRVLLARALAVEAPLLFVDEPIAALDPYHQLQVMEILQGLSRRGVGVLAVVHELALAARFMDRLILMDEGAVVADGATDEVLSQKRLSSVYGISALNGSEGGVRWLLPWARCDSARAKGHAG
jgi:iron complex transport system ATP-binding protein